MAPSTSGRAQATAPVHARFPANSFVVGAGVAIFHLATARVVVIYDPTHKAWVLPKGRRDVHEHTPQAGEREGYEESGYRNRLLPLPITHRQPQPRTPLDPRLSDLSTEPVWVELIPQSPTSQYLLYWYISETLSPAEEKEVQEAEGEGGLFGKAYVYPPKWPTGMTIAERVALERGGYEPVKHEDTTSDEEEMLYESHLLPIEEAMEKLSTGSSTMVDVVRRGWELILLRMKMEGGGAGGAR